MRRIGRCFGGRWTSVEFRHRNCRVNPFVDYDNKLLVGHNPTYRIAIPFIAEEQPWRDVL